MNDHCHACNHEADPAAQTVSGQVRAARTKTIIFTNSARFELGSIVATPGALDLLQETGFSAAALINRHVHGDWGDCCPEDAAMNDQASVNGSRILSVYRLVLAEVLKVTPVPKRADLPTVWIITDAADDDGRRQCTTILRPEDY